MSERKRRIGENEAIFRSVNEQVDALNATLSKTTETMRIVCECGTRPCTDQIAIRPEAYSEVRQDSSLLLTKPGHDFPEVEAVVAKHEGYWTVRKDPGLPTRIAGATDPRA